MTTRRTLLAMTAGTALAVTLPATVASAAPARSAGIPSTLATRRFAATGNLFVPEGDFPITHLGVVWQGPLAEVRMRTAAGWGEWRTMDGCSGGRDDHLSTADGAFIVTPGMVGYEVRVAGGGPAQTAELNTVDGPVVAPAGFPTGQLEMRGGITCRVPYLSRAAWGADESLRFRDGVEYWPPAYFPVQTLTVHHTAGANDDPDPAATVRAIYYFHAITRDFGDIGYQLLIDEAGRVYEGRWSGTDPVPVFGSTPGPDGRPLMVNGGHALGFNAGNIGVALLGTFTDRLPTAAAYRSLTAVLAALATLERLDPLGRTDYVNPISGAARTVDAVSGHRDWNATECPGNLFYPQLPSLRKDVAALMFRT